MKLDNFPDVTVEERICIDTEFYFVCRIWVNASYSASMKIQKNHNGYKATLWLEHTKRDKEWTCSKSINPIGTYESLREKYYKTLDACYHDNLPLAKVISVKRYNEIVAQDLRESE